MYGVLGEQAYENIISDFPELIFITYLKPHTPPRVIHSLLILFPYRSPIGMGDLNVLV